MAKEEQILKYAKLLKDAEDKKIPAINPISKEFEGMTVDDAYKIQMKNIEERLANGERITGKKIGLTSYAMQKLIGVDQPDYGHLFDSMEVTDGMISIDKLIQPKVEGEIAFKLKKDLKGPNVTVDDVLDATDYLIASLELVDSRIKEWRISLLDTVADNASSSYYVLGDKGVRIDAIDLPGIKMSLYKNGELISSDTGAAVLDNPAYAVAWLANKLWDYGVVLKKDEIVLSGAITAAVPAVKGDYFEAVFSDLGSVSVRFI